jgi:hypothetical protein
LKIWSEHLDYAVLPFQVDLVRRFDYVSIDPMLNAGGFSSWRLKRRTETTVIWILW